MPDFLAHLAEAQGKGKQGEPEWALLDEAFALIEKNSERWYEAEVYRLKGELLLAKESKRQKSDLPSTQPLTPSTQKRPKSVFTKPLRSRKSNKPNRGNSAPRSA